MKGVSAHQVDFQQTPWRALFNGLLQLLWRMHSTSINLLDDVVLIHMRLVERRSAGNVVDAHSHPIDVLPRRKSSCRQSRKNKQKYQNANLLKVV